MNDMYMVPNAVRHAGTEVTEIASRIRITSSEDEVRASNDQLAGTNLGAAAERAANALVKARTTFSKRLDSHSEALVHAVCMHRHTWREARGRSTIRCRRQPRPEGSTRKSIGAFFGPTELAEAALGR